MNALSNSLSRFNCRSITDSAKRMVRAWYISHCTVDDRQEPHMLDPPEYVTVPELKKLKVLIYQLNPLDYEGKLNRIRRERGYNFADEVTINREQVKDFDNAVKLFFREHIHENEEVRYLIEGSGYFDVRDLNDRWIRVHAERGDLLIVPTGLFHRFTVDHNEHIRAIRMFIGSPIWAAYYRSEGAETHPSRLAYLKSVKAQNQATQSQMFSDYY